MKIRRREENGCTVLELRGRLNATSAAAATETFEAVADGSSGAVLVDMKGVTSMDASGLGALASFHNRLAASGRPVGLCGLRDQPRTLMVLMGIRQIHRFVSARVAATLEAVPETSLYAVS